MLKFALALAAVASFPPLKREPIIDQQIPTRTVTQVKGATIRFAPGQPTGRHRHPVPVVGQVTEGSFVFQVDGQPARTLKTGDAFYEPEGATIVRFDNASSRRPAAITAFYLLERPDAQLIELLDR